jgi:molybdopterin-guanine dinucleotide biosynthesis protein A
MLSVVVQAGGQSRRMGRDKGLVPFAGQPLIKRVVERLASLGDEILVTTNRPQDYRFLGLPLIGDLLPGQGALGGLYTALSAASQPLVAVVACDMPFASQALLAAARDRLLNSNDDVVMPQSLEGLEPLHAVYRRATCLPVVEAALRDGRRRMISWLDLVETHIMLPDVVQQFDPAGRIFINLNTPQELAEAEHFAMGE